MLASKGLSLCRMSKAPSRGFPYIRQHRTLTSNGAPKTYYDSQSGMHVPIHNESEIYVYLHCIDPHLQPYKNSDDALVIQENLEELYSTRFDGVFFSAPLKLHRDEDNLESTGHIAPTSNDFLLFVPPFKNINALKDPNVVVVTDCDEVSCDELKEYKQRGIRTAITVTNDYADVVEPAEIAKVAGLLIDGSGGGDFVFVQCLEQEDDYIVDLCEELFYLDVPGPIMKSRIMIDCHPETTSDDLVDQVMSLGVNKFVLYQEEQLQDCIQAIAEEQGKQLANVVLGS